MFAELLQQALDEFFRLVDGHPAPRIDSPLGKEIDSWLYYFASEEVSEAFSELDHFELAFIYKAIRDDRLHTLQTVEEWLDTRQRQLESSYF